MFSLTSSYCWVDLFFITTQITKYRIIFYYALATRTRNLPNIPKTPNKFKISNRPAKFEFIIGLYMILLTIPIVFSKCTYCIQTILNCLFKVENI